MKECTKSQKCGRIVKKNEEEKTLRQNDKKIYKKNYKSKIKQNQIHCFPNFKFASSETFKHLIPPNYNGGTLL